MKHVRDMSTDELLAAMRPQFRRRFLCMTPEKQQELVTKIADAQDSLHDAAVWSSWMRQGLFYQ